jgi:hypothetical protein
MGFVPITGGMLVASGSMMVLSGGRAVRSPAVCRPVRLCVVANGGVVAMDRVSILSGMMCLAACVTSVVDNGVDVRRVSPTEMEARCVTKEEKVATFVRRQAVWFVSHLETVEAAVG